MRKTRPVCKRNNLTGKVKCHHNVKSTADEIQTRLFDLRRSD